MPVGLYADDARTGVRFPSRERLSVTSSSYAFRWPVRSRWRTQQPAQRITLPLGQRAEAIHHPRYPIPIITGKPIRGIIAGRPTFRRVLARTADW